MGLSGVSTMQTMPKVMPRLATSLLVLWLVSMASSGCDDSSPPDTDAGADADADVDNDAGDDADGDGDDLGPWPAGRYIAPDAVHARLVAGDPDMLLLNVVDEEFYDLGSIEGSLIIPWDLLEGRLSEVDAARSIVIYCRLGVRSESAYDTLDDHGYEHIWIMEGGITAWTDLGYPVVH